jgi:hypothetical protein
MSVQYYFYKKTGEVVFDKTILTRRCSEKNNPNKVVESLYGVNQGKTYIVSNSQLTNICQNTPLNIWEKIQLKTAHLSKNKKRIQDIINNIKKVRGNNLPPKWKEFLLSDYGTDKLYDTDSCSSSSSDTEEDLPNKSLDLLDKNVNIFTINLPKLLGITPNNDFTMPMNINKGNINKNEIRFEFQEFGGVIIQVVDFLNRIRWNLLMNQQEIITIPLGSCIYFDKPFEQELLINRELKLSKKELLETIIQWTKEKIQETGNKYDIDNFGLEKIEIVKSEKKQILNRYIIKYLYE